MNELPLRERKYAATKANLIEALTSRLKTQSLEDIAVKEVCNTVQVSQTTFFNYFPTKQHVIGYRVQLWNIAVAWEMDKLLTSGGSHLEAIRTLFDLTARAEDRNPGVMREVVAFQTRRAFSFEPLTPAEYAHHFPNMPEDARVEATGVNELIGAQLKAAQEAKELATDTDLEALALTLMGVFFLTPILLDSSQTGSLADAYHRQLEILFPNKQRSEKRKS
jgi:AcrR family transcriptional regulator